MLQYTCLIYSNDNMYYTNDDVIPEPPITQPATTNSTFPVALLNLQSFVGLSEAITAISGLINGKLGLQTYLHVVFCFAPIQSGMMF